MNIYPFRIFFGAQYFCAFIFYSVFHVQTSAQIFFYGNRNDYIKTSVDQDVKLHMTYLEQEMLTLSEHRSSLLVSGKLLMLYPCLSV